MARGRRGIAFSRHPGHGKAGRTAQRSRKSFRRIARKSPGGTTKRTPYSG